MFVDCIIIAVHDATMIWSRRAADARRRREIEKKQNQVRLGRSCNYYI